MSSHQHTEVENKFNGDSIGLNTRQDIPDGAINIKEAIAHDDMQKEIFNGSTSLLEKINHGNKTEQENICGEDVMNLQDDITDDVTGPQINSNVKGSQKDIITEDLQNDDMLCSIPQEQTSVEATVVPLDDIQDDAVGFPHIDEASKSLKDDNSSKSAEHMTESPTDFEYTPDGPTDHQKSNPDGLTNHQEPNINRLTDHQKNNSDRRTDQQDHNPARPSDQEELLKNQVTDKQKPNAKKVMPQIEKRTDNITDVQENVPDGAMGLQSPRPDGLDNPVNDVEADGAMGLQSPRPDGLDNPVNDVEADGAMGLQSPRPDGLDNPVNDVEANGAMGLQLPRPDGLDNPVNWVVITDGAMSLQPSKTDGHDSPISGIVEPITPIKVDRFGFTGGKQFEEHRDNHLPISVLRKRELKWLDMLEDWSKWMSKKPKKVKERCRKGIPPALRARAWQYLSGSKNLKEKNKLVFAELDAQDGEHKWVELIEKDLDRQFPFHEMFAKGAGGQKDLFRILKAYSIYNPRDGYCQAQAPIAAVLVMHMPAEDAFWCLVQICEKYLVGYFSPGLEAMQIDGDVLLGLMKRHLTTTYRHMVEQHIEPVHYMTEWFMCIFSRTFPFATVLRVWDIFLCEGVKVLFKVALVIIKHTLSSKRQLEECPGFYETIQKLKHIPSEVVEEEFLINEVIEMRVFEKEFEAEHSLQVARRNAVKQRQLRHSNQVEMAKQVAEIKQKKKIKSKSKVQLKKPLSQSHGSLNFLSSDYEDSSVTYSLPNTPGQRRLEERDVQTYSQKHGSPLRSKITSSQSTDELSSDVYLNDQEVNSPENGLNGTKTDKKVKKDKKKAKEKKKEKIK